MHDTALELGRAFFERYLPQNEGCPRVLDIGSMDMNGSLRSVLPADRIVKYTGVDLEAGVGVDVVVRNTAALPFDQNWFDVVVSTSCFEHDEHFWSTFDEAVRVLAPGGYLYINAPSNGHFHQHPLDCWRFYPDAGLALARWANREKGSGSRVQGASSERASVPSLNPASLNPEPLIELIESFVFERQGAEWNDNVMVFGKLPLAASLPEPLSRLPGARNIRRRGNEGIGRIEFFTEDQRLGARLATSAHHLMSTLRADTMRASLDGTPLLSVVVSYYQGEHTDEEFERCYRSIREQDAPIEIIVVHDGPLLRRVPAVDSSRRGPLVMTTDEFAGDHGHAARGEGLHYATGLYILHADADFEYAPGALAELAAQLRAEPVGMVIAEVDLIGYELAEGGAMRKTPDRSKVVHVEGVPPSGIDLMQVVLRRGLAFSYGFPTRSETAAAQLFQAIADEHGYCRSPIRLGQH